MLVANSAKFSESRPAFSRRDVLQGFWQRFLANFPGRSQDFLVPDVFAGFPDGDFRGSPGISQEVTGTPSGSRPDFLGGVISQRLPGDFRGMSSD